MVADLWGMRGGEKVAIAIGGRRPSSRLSESRVHDLEARVEKLETK